MPETDTALLAGIARQAQLSARLQAARAAALGGEAHALRQQVHAIRASFFWRLTGPVRQAVDFARGAPGSPSWRRALALAKERGLAAVLERARERARIRRQLAAAAPRPGAPAPFLAGYEAPPSRDPAALLAPRVLIVGELTLPQCAKYRVWQKQELFARLGIEASVVDWRDVPGVLGLAATATQVILYRVPFFPEVQQMVAALRRLRLPLAFEVDDLIFDRDLFLQNRNIDTLDPELREGVISGVDLYRNCMLACDWGIASTGALAAAMRGCGLARVETVENALDDETLGIAGRLRAARSPHDGIVITYGSGTKTHNADFAEAVPGLLDVLRERPEVRLRIVGELTLDPAFDRFGDRVERVPPLPFGAYLEQLAASDISLAPLEPTLFNDAKSNIKFLEAAIVGVPSVCSPRATFTSVIESGVNGMLADGAEGWRRALLTLIDDSALRARMGEAALATALDRYAPDAVARRQLAPLFRDLDRRPARDLRVLAANIYFWPRSYGGATIVAEEMARRFAAMDGTEIVVATGLDNAVRPRVLRRYEHEGLTIFGLPVTEGSDAIGEFDNPAIGESFGQVLDAVQPDIVHLHAVQWLTASVALACRTRNVPYVVTLHDCWWLCERQFMVTGSGKFCGQTRIEPRICEACIPGARHIRERRALLLETLAGAAQLISPSEAHRRLFVANGIDPEKIVVAPNGVRLPARPRPRREPRRLRFAYVGGPWPIKGFPLVRAAFESLERGDWELLLVDSTLKLGFPSLDIRGWRVRGEVTIVPPYAQDDLDTFFDGIDVLLFPSQWRESFGLTVREALARDVWVITTEGGGPAEAVTDGVNGTLIPLDGRSDALSAALRAILADAPRFLNFVNPRKGEIIDYAEQAVALRRLLADAARQPAVPAQE